MGNDLWGHRRPPPTGADTVRVGRWEPAGIADLTSARRRLAADVQHADGADGGAVERLLLVFEEIGSNALRHGGAPVDITVCSFGNYWLLEVGDTDVSTPPTPAVDRDAAEGGLGLYLVGQICGAHGWYVDGTRKVAWARIDYTRAEAPPEITASLPRPSLARSGSASAP